MMTLENVEVGVTVNRIRKLQRQWDYWFPRRQHDPLSPRNAEQEIAEHECTRLAPLLHDSKQRLAALERGGQ